MEYDRHGRPKDPRKIATEDLEPGSLVRLRGRTIRVTEIRPATTWVLYEDVETGATDARQLHPMNTWRLAPTA